MGGTALFIKEMSCGRYFVAGAIGAGDVVDRDTFLRLICRKFSSVKQGVYILRGSFFI